MVFKKLRFKGTDCPKNCGLSSNSRHWDSTLSIERDCENNLVDNFGTLALSGNQYMNEAAL